MIAPKIEICIEGYNIEQTDFYIAHLLDKYNSLNELYKKSCEHIVFLEKECKDGFGKAICDIMSKLDSVETRISDIEKKISCSDEISVCTRSDEQFKAELSDFHSELNDIKSLFAK